MFNWRVFNLPIYTEFTKSPKFPAIWYIHVQCMYVQCDSLANKYMKGIVIGVLSLIQAIVYSFQECVHICMDGVEVTPWESNPGCRWLELPSLSYVRMTSSSPTFHLSTFSGGTAMQHAVSYACITAVSMCHQNTFQCQLEIILPAYKHSFYPLSRLRTFKKSILTPYIICIDVSQ